MFSKKLFIIITTIFIILSVVSCDYQEDLRNQRRIVEINHQEEIPPHLVQLEQQQQQLQEAPQEAIIIHIHFPAQGLPLGEGLPQGVTIGEGQPQGLLSQDFVNMISNFFNAQIQHAHQQMQQQQQQQHQPQEEFEEIN